MLPLSNYGRELKHYCKSLEDGPKKITIIKTVVTDILQLFKNGLLRNNLKGRDLLVDPG